MSAKMLKWTALIGSSISSLDAQSIHEMFGLFIYEADVEDKIYLCNREVTSREFQNMLQEDPPDPKEFLLFDPDNVKEEKKS